MILIIIFIFLILCLFFCIKLNSKTSKESIESINPIIEKFNNTNNRKIIEFSNNFNFIYTTIDGDYKIIIDNNLWGFNRQSNHIGSISKLFNSSQKDLYIKTGYYNYSNNTIVLLDTLNNIYTLLIDDNRLLDPVFYKNRFRGIEEYIDGIDCLFYLNNLVYIFKGTSTLIYCLTKDEILLFVDTDTIFKKCDMNKIECCFINNNHIKVYNPVPLIYMKHKNNIYIYIYKKFNHFEFYKKITDKIDNYPVNIELTPIYFKEALVNYSFDYTGYYRIITIGGGNNNGGYGGLIYNDYKFNKNDKLKIIIGSEGSRLPIKNSLGINNLNNKLSFYGSCSGAGGTFIFKNDKVMMASGGGGGWSSEIIHSPDICNSLKFQFTKPTMSKIKPPDFYFPISKIKIETERTSANNSYKLVIHKLDIKNDNYDFINIEVLENPLYDKLELKNKKHLYETSYTKYGEKASIEISFNKVLTDYTIDLKYFVKQFNKKKDIVNSVIYFYDEQNRSYTINNFNFLFKKKLTSRDILSYLSKNKLPSIIKPKNKFIENGHNIKKIADMDITPMILKDNKIFLKGGIGGGGNSYTNRYAKDIYCGGGGGYFGGKACILSDYDSESIPTTYIAGSGGASYIDKLNFKQKDVLNHLFINNYNSGNGKILIYKINNDN